ncbi:MAG TPA: hypothetical protein VIC33_03090 [Vicinamibacterales bacterium]
MIDIIIAGRNDAFGGADFVDRLCAAASANHQALERASVAHRFTLVEWNPIPGRKSLSSIVTSRLPWWDACFVVPAEWHRRLSENPHLQFMEFFAKNAAIRRSPAPLILTTNSDVFFSQALVERLARGDWRDRCVYRAERVDVDRGVNWREPDERVFADPAHQVRVNRLSGPDYGNSAGDFLLLTRDSYHELGGFNETVRFAKIHKDGQFCHRAWRRGLAFEVLGTIWHIDHDGSYANAGSSLGSATAPYGPEWDYRVEYENEPGWGLASAVAERTGRRITTLQHPSVSGPLLSVISADGSVPDPEPPGEELEIAPAIAAVSVSHRINDGLARSHGKYLCIVPGPLTADVAAECLAATRELRERAGDLGVPSWAVVQDAASGWLGVDDAPLVMSRDLYEQVGGLDQTESDPLRAFFFTAAASRQPHLLSAWEAPVAGPARCAIRARRGLMARTAQEPARQGSIEERSVAVCEYLSSSADIRGWLAHFVARVTAKGGRGAECGIIGLDWATPWLIEALQAADCRCAGVFSPDRREIGTMHWGERMRAIEDLAVSPATDLFVTVPQPMMLERIVAAGYGHAVHVLAVDPALARAPRIPSELDRLRAAQARDLKTEHLDGVLARIEPLAALEGPHWALHAYDAALLCDRQGRSIEALRLFSDAADPRNPDASLRARAAFHQGRLLADSHDDARAVQVFDGVLTQQPDHGKAWEYLVTVLRRAKDAAKLEARLSPAIRDRWRQGVFAPGYAR